MNGSGNIEGLLEIGFTMEQVEQLNKLRSLYAEKVVREVAAEQRRLEFARWLIVTGRLTDQVAREEI